MLSSHILTRGSNHYLQTVETITFYSCRLFELGLIPKLAKFNSETKLAGNGKDRLDPVAVVGPNSWRGEWDDFHCLHGQCIKGTQRNFPDLGGGDSPPWPSLSSATGWIHTPIVLTTYTHLFWANLEPTAALPSSFYFQFCAFQALLSRARI